MTALTFIFSYPMLPEALALITVLLAWVFWFYPDSLVLNRYSKGKHILFRVFNILLTLLAVLMAIIACEGSYLSFAIFIFWPIIFVIAATIVVISTGITRDRGY